MVAEIAIRREAHVALTYELLSHLDLGADAASLFAPERPPRPWVAPLLAAYREAPGRLLLQGLALWVDDERGLLAALDEPRRGGFEDETSAELARRFAQAYRREAPSFAERYQPAARARKLAGRDRWLLRRLPALRAAMGAMFGVGGESPVPPLTILDCPALRCGGFTHGRACHLPQRRLIAVACDAPAEQLLCQLLHEELHSLTDPPILAAHRGGPRETAVGTSGFELHRALEAAAVEAGRELLQGRAPSLLPAYDKRFGPPTVR